MIIEHRVEINRKPADIFAIYKSVDSWPLWDHDIEAVALDGPFSVGTSGWLKPKGAPKTRTRIVELKEPHRFTVESKLPFCSMRFAHELTAVENGTQALHRVVFSGPLAPLFRIVIGGKIRKTIAGTMHSLKRYAES